jgi:hydroxypyruvate isomerase
MKAEIDRHRLTILGLNTPRGEREGEFGLAAVPGREKDWDLVFGKALDYIAAIGGNAVHCLAGKVEPNERPAADRVFAANLSRAADLAAAKKITLLLEPINPRDRPGYFLNHLEHAADVVARVGKPNVRIQFDFYHMQIVGGDLIHRLEQYLPVIGHLQCGAVPSRHEPDEGEISYRAVFEAVDRLGYRGWIGAEYRPRGRTEEGLGWAQPYGVMPP